MYYILGFIAFLLLVVGIFLMVSKNRKFTIGFICVSLAVCAFVAIPIIAVHSFFFSPAKTETRQENKIVDMDWNATISNSVHGDVDAQVLEQILKSFSRRCIPVLQKYPDCVEYAKAEIVQYNANDRYQMYRQEDYGWLTEIEIKIKIKENTSVIENDYVLSGQTMTFVIGAGNAPGIEADKGESATFIGVSKSEIPRGQKIFIPVEDYKIVDQLVKE